MFRNKKTRDIFRKHYTKICEIVKQMTYSKDPEFEILPIMYVVATIAVANTAWNHPNARYAEPISKELTSMVPKEKEELFFSLVESNKLILTGEVELRFHWTTNDNEKESFNSDGVLRCVGNLGDTLFFSANAPSNRVKNGEKNLAQRFRERILYPLTEEFTSYYNDLYALWSK